MSTLSCAGPVSQQPGLPNSTPTTSHLSHAWWVSAFEGVLLQQRPHQASAAVGEGVEAVFAMVASHAAVSCGGGDAQVQGALRPPDHAYN